MFGDVAALAKETGDVVGEIKGDWVGDAMYEVDA
jgi:hypothetical protein